MMRELTHLQSGVIGFGFAALAFSDQTLKKTEFLFAVAVD